MEELEITIEKDGTTRIRVLGVQGAHCLELTREIEERLGEVVNRTFTTEYYEESERRLVHESLKKERP